MIVNLDTPRLKTLDDVRAFLAGSSPFEFTLTDRADAYRWIEATLRQLRYATLGKADINPDSLDRPHMALGGITPKQRLAMAA